MPDSPPAHPGPVLILTRPRLDAWPLGEETGLWIRSFSGGKEDLEHWLRIQNAAFARGGSAPAWDRTDFARELSRRPWWRPERLLLAGWTEIPVGTVAWEPIPADGVVQLHWLAVDPSTRRRGVARGLIQAAAQRVDDPACRQIRAETLIHWAAAVACYRSLGFQDSTLDRTS